MAYNGYLVKVGDYTFPNEYIMMKTYKASYKVQDLDPYRDGNGVLHRNALAHTPPTCSFQIRPLTNTEYDSIMGSIRSNYTNSKERKASVSIFMPELGEYVLSDMYMPDPEITIIGQRGNTLKYDAITFEFIGY
jgi:hypothetical protein